MQRIQKLFQLSKSWNTQVHHKGPLQSSFSIHNSSLPRKQFAKYSNLAYKLWYSRPIGSGTDINYFLEYCHLSGIISDDRIHYVVSYLLLTMYNCF